MEAEDKALLVDQFVKEISKRIKEMEKEKENTVGPPNQPTQEIGKIIIKMENENKSFVEKFMKVIGSRINTMEKENIYLVMDPLIKEILRIIILLNRKILLC
jgi:hypothetical protein